MHKQYYPTVGLSWNWDTQPHVKYPCQGYTRAGMLGEAVKILKWRNATSTHTHNTHECKNIFFSKIPLKYIILVVFEIQKIKNHFKYTVITLDFVFIHSWCHSSTMKCYCIISGKTPKIKYSKICNFWTVNSITVIFFHWVWYFFLYPSVWIWYWDKQLQFLV